MTNQDQPAHLPALTGLRFIAALLVVFMHFGSAAAPSWLRPFAEVGAVGVCLFFVLSGFILTYTYSAPGGGFRGSARAFYAARVARLCPVYLLALAIAILPAVWDWTQYPEAMSPLLPALSTLSMTQAWLPGVHFVWDAPAWSLSVEAFFYALFPALLRRTARLPILWIVVLFAGSCLATQIAPTLYESLRPDTVNAYPAPYWLDVALFNPLVCLPEFVAGMALGLFFLRVPRPAYSGAFTMLAGVITLWTLDLAAGWDGLRVRDGLLVPVFGALILGLAWHRGPLVRVLATRPLVALGEASYALYLLHFPLHELLVRILRYAPVRVDAGGAVFVAYLLLSVSISLLVYRAVEAPGRRALRRWLAPQGVSAAIPSYTYASPGFTAAR
jgi:peptidoglycan/LPS O-acetylase OafA/YrhL